MVEGQMKSSWFALFVRPNHEKNVSYVLEQKGIENLLPLYRVRKKWSDRYKEVDLPLFPGVCSRVLIGTPGPGIILLE